MTDTNYPLEALEILLDESCLSQRYYSLIPHKMELISRLHQLGCRRKADAQALSDEVLLGMGWMDAGKLLLFRRFLALYDPKPQKLREPETITDPEKRAAFRELYLLPGVKQVRAELYYQSGFRSLLDFADAAPETVLARTSQTIAEHHLPCTTPLPKEVRTHIAVAKAFTGFRKIQE